MRHSINFVAFVQDKDWPHFLWRVVIGDQSFDYKTGTGHGMKFSTRDGGYARRPKDKRTLPVAEFGGWAYVPEIDSVLDCLFLDAQSGKSSFSDFCSDFGYSNDSLKALDTYRACEDTRKRLRLALGPDYQAQHDAWEKRQS